jgi:hypothetical protein
MNRRDERRLAESLSLLLGAYRLISDGADLIGSVLTGCGAGDMMESAIVSDGTTYTLTGNDMEQTVSGKNVGDSFSVRVGPATDVRGKQIKGPETIDFEVSDPAILGLEIDPAGVTVQDGQRAARVTLLDQGDATLTASLHRPTKDPLVSTVRVTGTNAETADAATDLPIEVVGDEPGPVVAQPRPPSSGTPTRPTGSTPNPTRQRPSNF